MRLIRNYDVASYYPHLMTIDGYTSRNIPNPQTYADMLEERIKAKKSGDKKTANALKLVANTTYGAMLNKYNDLYDPLMGRSVCITGQLRLLELANHLCAVCSTLKVIQLNTDGIMISFEEQEYPAVQEIVQEWQDRTGFELEEDKISAIIQKDVNNYIEIAEGGSVKAKGGMLVRGIAQAGAFNINNNAPIIAKAVAEYLAKGTHIEDTINSATDILDFQLIAKASGKYKAVYHIVNGERVPVQRCNRVYAAKDWLKGTLVKVHKETGKEEKISGLPTRCVIDNANELTLDAVNKEWYINQAYDNAKAFLGAKKSTTGQLTRKMKNLLKLLEN